MFVRTLLQLHEELRSLGSGILVLENGPLEGWKSLLHLLRTQTSFSPQLVTWNRDYEPFARQRDEKVEALLKFDFSIPVKTYRDHLILEPSEFGKEGGFYQVYSPFKKRWLHTFHSSPEIQERVLYQTHALKKTNAARFSEKIGVELGAEFDRSTKLLKHWLQKTERKLEETFPKILSALPEVGHLAARKALETFSPKVSQYPSDRDIPSVKGTSRLSVYLKNGSLTTSQVLSFLELSKAEGPSSLVSGREKYWNELIWREFYYHILWHRPDVEHGSFLPQFQHLPWSENLEHFQAWKDGRTGYPIVDAGMRELQETGFMHNRVRMIVASFLTKHLRIDWRWGEKHFMNLLLDGDLAPNNGGWQWAASTGCDPQPYFRIFNPTLQSEKFDPEGLYIKTWIPELRSLSGKSIHLPTALERRACRYPDEIVEHKKARELAISTWKTTQARYKASASLKE
jgi:deoxyribodipyrimidine photo-lyase